MASPGSDLRYEGPLHIPAPDRRTNDSPPDPTHRAVEAPSRQASSGMLSLTVSSWPTVSLPNSTGTKAPINATAASVPKNIVGEPVYGSSMKGATTPATNRPQDSPKYWPRPRNAVGNCSDRNTRTAVKVDNTVKPVISAPATNTTVARDPVVWATAIIKRPGSDPARQ